MMRGLAFASLTLVLVTGSRADAQDFCATQPPPEGLVERCRSKIFSFPSGTADRYRQAVFEVTLVEWMRGCVISWRAPGLVFEAQKSVDRAFELIKDLSDFRFVRIVPVYTALQFTDGGRTCFGVKSVSFRVAGTQGTVDAGGDIDIIPGPTSDMVKEAAAAARKALQDPSVRGSASLSRFLNVLAALERSGKDFDDTWYNVQPFGSGDAMNAGACYKDFRVGQGQACRPADEALKACERHLADDLVQSYFYDKVSPRRYAEILEIRAADIQRSIDHVADIQKMDSPAALPCPSIKSVFMPRIADLARRNSVYGAGGY